MQEHTIKGSLFKWNATYFTLAFVLTFLLKPAGALCQSFPVDSSYSLHATYVKELKRYPMISPVVASLNETLVATKEIVYAVYGERQLHLDIYRTKKAEKSAPLVILIHGGGWKSGDRSMQMPMAIYLADRGYVTMLVEYRKSLEALYPAAAVDIKTAIRWARVHAEEFGIDPKRIAVLGGSSGGHLAALMGATNQSTKYIDEAFFPEVSVDVQAVVDIDGILAFIHPESGEGADKPGRPSAATFWFGGNQSEKESLWRDASPLTHAGKNMPPILFINSQFPRFHAGRDDLIARMDSLEIYTEVHTIDGTPHPFWLFNPWFNQTAEWTRLFLNKVFQ